MRADTLPFLAEMGKWLSKIPSISLTSKNAEDSQKSWKIFELLRSIPASVAWARLKLNFNNLFPTPFLNISSSPRLLKITNLDDVFEPSFSTNNSTLNFDENFISSVIILIVLSMASLRFFSLVFFLNLKSKFLDLFCPFAKVGSPRKPG